MFVYTTTMAIKFSKKRRGFKRRAVKRRPLRRRKAPVAIKKLVRREIARNVENKDTSKFNLSVPIRSVAHGSFASQVFQLNPSAAAMNINQGTGQGGRVGNVIKLKKLTLKGTIVPQPYSAGSNPTPQPVQVKVWIFYDKLATPHALLNPYAAGDFFQYGGSVANFQNDLADTWLPVNEDRYKVFATRTMKVGVANSNGTGASADSQFWTNNDFKLNSNFSFNLLPYAIKTQKYNDNTADPSCRGLYVMFVPSYAGGGPVDNAATVANVAYVINCEYEDA